jgi:uncharacterized protein YegL
MTQQSNERSLLRSKRPVGGMKQPQTFSQLGILVLDGSGSMHEQTAKKITKGEEVSLAVRDLFSRFQNSKISKNFQFAVVYYDHGAKMILDVTDMKNIDVNRSYNPTDKMGGTTSIAEGLKVAKQIADNFLSKKVPGGLSMKVLMLIMSDGLDMTEQETLSVVNSIKSNNDIQIASCFFETLGGDINGMNEAATFLKSLVTDDGLFARVNDTENLRNFFERSMSNVASRKI